MGLVLRFVGFIFQGLGSKISRLCPDCARVLYVFVKVYKVLLYTSAGFHEHCLRTICVRSGMTPCIPRHCTRLRRKEAVNATLSGYDMLTPHHVTRDVRSL